MQIAKIIKGPHVLFTGANGKKTAGIKVRALKKRDGFSSEWCVNCTELNSGYDPELLGSGPIEMYKIIHECKELENAEAEC